MGLCIDLHPVLKNRFFDEGFELLLSIDVKSKYLKGSLSLFLFKNEAHNILRWLFSFSKMSLSSVKAFTVYL